MNVLNNPQNVYQEKINNIFKRKTSSETEIIFKTVDLLFYNSIKSTDLFQLYKALDLESFIKVCSIIDGREIRLPKKAEIEELFLTALLYHDRDVKKMEWTDIKKKYPEMDISSIKYSFKIKKLNEFVERMINQLFKDYEGDKNE